MSSAWNKQVGGDHYSHFAIQPSMFIARNKLPWYAGNVIKYVCRAPFRGSLVPDLRKAIHYIELWIEEWEAQQAVTGMAESRATASVGESDTQIFDSVKYEMNK